MGSVPCFLQLKVDEEESHNRSYGDHNVGDGGEHLGLTKYFLIASLMTRAWNDPTMLSQGDVEIATLPIQAQGFVM